MFIKGSINKSNLNKPNIINSSSENLNDYGNGSLRIFVVKSAENWGNDFRFLKMGINYAEWEALFFDVLRCPNFETPIIGELASERWERNRFKFQQAIPNYPMLGRIYDMYLDVSYSAEEVTQLREECYRIEANTSNNQALNVLRKIIFACNEALSEEKGLLLRSD